MKVIKAFIHQCRAADSIPVLKAAGGVAKPKLLLLSPILATAE
jgi:hypothetical protein